MSAENVRMLIPPYLSGDLDQEELELVESRLESDAAFQAEVENLRYVWQQLGLLPMVEPSAALRAQFYQKLNARVNGRAGNGRWWRASWVWQAAAAVVVFVVGFGAGQWRTAHDGSRRMEKTVEQPTEVSQLRSQVEGLRETVALSMMEKPSASTRLAGVEWSTQVDRPDQELTTALLTTLNDDQNINVRLAALDALEKFTAVAAVRTGLEESIAKQQSPLVQIALIDALVHVRDRSAAPEFKQLSENARVNAVVRQRAQWAVEKLTVN